MLAFYTPISRVGGMFIVIGFNSLMGLFMYLSVKIARAIICVLRRLARI